MSKAQITFTLIIVVVIILVALLLFLLPSSQQFGNNQVPDPAFGFVTSCLEQAGTKAILYVGATGGYAQAHIPGPIPSISSIEQALAIKTKEILPACYDSFSAFRTQGIRITAGNPRVRATLTKTRVIMNLDQSIEVYHQQTIKKHRQFSATLNIPLLDVIQEARRLQVKHPEGVDITELVRKNMNGTLFVG